MTTPAHAAGHERVLNGSFDLGKTPWWSSGNTPSKIVDGRLCADVPAGTVNPWNSMVGQNDIPLEAGQPYTLRFTASASRPVTIRAVVQSALNKPVTLSAPQSFEFSGTSTVSDIHQQVSFQLGGATEPYTLCVDDVSLTGGAIPPGGGWTYGSPVRVNQHAYALDGPKRATIVNSATKPVSWQLKDASGQAVRSGRTRVRGDDTTSGDHVHIADFTSYRHTGSGFTLVVGADASLPFDITENPYSRLSEDSLAYFYHNRSGTPIEADRVGEAYARPAGHLSDASVPCLPGVCDYSLDVRGGWYDAGDQGKYVVNGALAAWQLMDAYERKPDPAVRDEAMWEVEFLMRMQAPGGMVHHKIHDLAWTPLPTLPHQDPQPRYLHAVSTAATLNLAAAGAQCARVFQDPRCLTAAERAWTAANENPAVYAPRDDNVGGGPYDDTDVRDEFSWAAAELYATTGNWKYLNRITTTLTTTGFSWKDTGALADLTILRAPQKFPLSKVITARARLLSVANGYVKALRQQGYPDPAPGYAWGSASSTANAAMIMAMAYDLTKQPRYRDGVLESFDYLLGRNAVNRSFVTGYGERDARNQHHRHWAHQLDPKLPNPPPGALAGGPNSGLQDPVAQQNLRNCTPAKCYIDDIGSWSTNEVAINWNSALAWITAFADTGHTFTTAANPLDLTSGFYVNPNSAPATWARDHSNDPRAARIQSSIGSKPIARWFGDDANIGSTVAGYTGAADGNDKLPVLVAYNLPGRDACGGHSGGGAGSPAAYRTWISGFAAGIGAKPAVVVIEPDALGDFECMTQAQIDERNGMLLYATQMFQQKAPNTYAYLDGGNAGWVPAATMASRLKAAGVGNVRGFSVNVSNYYSTSASVSYANAVASGTSAKFVIDTSRNGNGGNGEWCNPAGRKLGTTAQAGGGAEMLLWIKTPGNSDGECGTAPTVPAGQFSPALAIRLIDGT
ncbi:glycoside hydrolase family 9 protein [Lentzea aerocolonigenes]|uniref:glycoside hydrolase family 9 protein n=1 Tax=Lentzea aerocolonigenes TaxID=68170 RepID=UPI0018C8B536|nr:glycoside hydrolase family 9 protein [Lentzea aerocolonigenes]